eukprot:CAMPEP_0183779632 /NCGR_PEP_ID=MMETSP0739-20130205/54355_1 /TAXON_ID=385413 /ORGANISM="Thalassiosira miniscula, Strain CCMP1093" /LENGTH=55 /DNA_ID=CAMNT_0026022319 /DNA_START=32 /DNA_END=195 /DNA_ORIENTATION=-
MTMVVFGKVRRGQRIRQRRNVGRRVHQRPSQSIEEGGELTQPRGVEAAARAGGRG